MKRLIILSFCFLLSFYYHSQCNFAFTDFEVGALPAAMFYEETDNIGMGHGKVHILCAGVDINFNGVYDDGEDTKATWWIIYEDGKTEEFKVFDEFIGFIPLRPYYRNTEESKELYLQTINGIKVFDVETGEEIDSPLSGESAVSVSGKNDMIILTDRDFEGNGVVKFFNIGQEQFIDEIEAGPFTQKAEVLKIDESGYIVSAILNEGNFGSEDANLTFYTFHPIKDSLDIKEFNVGGTANDLNIVEVNGEQRVYVVANGTHEVYIFNDAQELIDSVGTDTEGFNGPREIGFFSIDYIGDMPNAMKVPVISTWSKTIEIYYGGLSSDASSIAQREVIELPGNSEAVLGSYGELFVSIPYGDGFAPMNIVRMYEAVVSVEDDIITDNFEISPNPVREQINISGLFPHFNGSNQIDIRIVDIMGNTVKSERFVGNSNIIEINDLANGSYILIATNGRKIVRSRIVIAN